MDWLLKLGSQFFSFIFNFNWNYFFLNFQVKFREFIPSILNVSRQCLASGEEDVAVIAFEIFDELIESPAPLLGDSVRSIVQFSLEVCSSQNLESNTRHQVQKDHNIYFIVFFLFWTVSVVGLELYLKFNVCV